MAKTRRFWTSDKLVALTALVISLGSLFIFIRQTNIIEQQSRLSVMPYIIIDMSRNAENKTIAIDLVNHGVGPAIVVNREITYNGEFFDLEFKDFLRQKIENSDSIAIQNYSSTQRGLAIPAGGRRNIIRVGGDDRSYNDMLRILNEELVPSKFVFKLKYRSIYDDHWEISSETNEPISVE